jgi:hypothetical protein
MTGKEIAMPPARFAILLIVVIAAAGATIALAYWAEVPLALLWAAALAGSLILGVRRWM